MEVEGNRVKVVPAPVIFLGLFVLGFLLNLILPLPFLTNLPVARLTGIFVVCVSFLVGGTAVVEMRRVHTSPNPHKPTTALVEAGIFRYTRNPLYLSLFFLYIGIAVFVNVLWLILLSPFSILCAQNWVVKPEEHYLEQKFGDVYRKYKERVRRWI
jgi:protein-S-isoprenylcysteine O-methyltransferase Ste14